MSQRQKKAPSPLPLPGRAASLGPPTAGTASLATVRYQPPRSGRRKAVIRDQPGIVPGLCRTPRMDPRPVGLVPGRPRREDLREAVEVQDNRNVFQASPDQLPAIDIQSL
jgi:hypothetical protein